MHTIRLRGPWEATRFGTSQSVTFRRKFHRPSGLLGTQSICFVLSLTDTCACSVLSCILNGNALLQPESAENRQRFEIMQLLLPFNELQLEFQSSDRLSAEHEGSDCDTFSAYAEAWLEIED